MSGAPNVAARMSLRMLPLWLMRRRILPGSRPACRLPVCQDPVAVVRPRSLCPLVEALIVRQLDGAAAGSEDNPGALGVVFDEVVGVGCHTNTCSHAFAVGVSAGARCTVPACRAS
jgi:hypothetical protein